LIGYRSPSKQDQHKHSYQVHPTHELRCRSEHMQRLSESRQCAYQGNHQINRRTTAMSHYLDSWWEIGGSQPTRTRNRQSSSQRCDCLPRCCAGCSVPTFGGVFGRAPPLHLQHALRSRRPPYLMWIPLTRVPFARIVCPGPFPLLAGLSPLLQFCGVLSGCRLYFLGWGFCRG
jgi:hypothetical protein